MKNGTPVRSNCRPQGSPVTSIYMGMSPATLADILKVCGPGTHQFTMVEPLVLGQITPPLHTRAPVGRLRPCIDREMLTGRSSRSSRSSSGDSPDKRGDRSTCSAGHSTATAHRLASMTFTTARTGTTRSSPSSNHRRRPEPSRSSRRRPTCGTCTSSSRRHAKQKHVAKPQAKFKANSDFSAPSPNDQHHRYPLSTTHYSLHNHVRPHSKCSSTKPMISARCSPIAAPKSAS